MSERARLFAIFLLCLPLLAARAESLRDPTMPPGYDHAGGYAESASGPQELQLTAIFNVPGNPGAMINGRRVQPGDELAGGRVVAIRADAVLFERSGEILSLRLPVLSVKTNRQPQGGGKP